MKISKISTIAVTVPSEPPKTIRDVQVYPKNIPSSGARDTGSKSYQVRTTPPWLTPGVAPVYGVNRRATRMFNQKTGVYSIDYVFVKIETDDGLAGIGEAVCDIGFFGETVESVKYGIDRYLAPGLIGMNPFDRELVLARMASSHARQLPSARSGIDLAIHDLLGKALKIPVSNLIGGRRIEKVLVAIEVGAPTPEDLAELCLEYVKLGVQAFKLKMRGLPDEDFEKLRAVREAVGDKVTIRSDANQGLTVKDAIAFCKKAERHDMGLELLEQPVAEWDLDGMAEIKRSVDTLIEADEGAYSIYDVQRIINKRAADAILIKVGKAGGLYNAKKIAAVAESAGLQCVIGTGWGLGIKVASKLHLATSTLVRPAVEFSEIYMHDMLLAKPYDNLGMLEGHGPPLQDGCLPVPDGPGFGVELDENKVRKYITPDVP